MGPILVSAPLSMSSKRQKTGTKQVQVPEHYILPIFGEITDEDIVAIATDQIHQTLYVKKLQAKFKTTVQELIQLKQIHIHLAETSTAKIQELEKEVERLKNGA